MTKLESIRKHGLSAEGRRELMNYLKGKDLAMKQAIVARCYDCMSFYADGVADCKTTECPLYIFMPYRKVRRVRKAAKRKAPAQHAAGKNGRVNGTAKSAGKAGVAGKKPAKRETTGRKKAAPKQEAKTPVKKSPEVKAPEAKAPGKKMPGKRKRAPQPLSLF